MGEMRANDKPGEGLLTTGECASIGRMSCGTLRVQTGPGVEFVHDPEEGGHIAVLQQSVLARVSRYREALATIAYESRCTCPGEDEKTCWPSCPCALARKALEDGT